MFDATAEYATKLVPGESPVVDAYNLFRAALAENFFFADFVISHQVDKTNYELLATVVSMLVDIFDRAMDDDLRKRYLAHFLHVANEHADAKLAELNGAEV